MIGQMGTPIRDGSFRMTVVGCSGSYPGPDSPASCYLVQAELDGRTWNVVVDLGNGALGALQRYIDPLDVDAVLLSHLHADHCVDMTSYYVLRKYHPRGQQPKIPVWGPSGTDLRLANAYDLPREPGMREEFEFHIYDGPFSVGPFAIEAFPVDHPVEAYGMRISVETAGGRRTLAYSGDTGPTPSLLDIAAEADLFLSEASFRHGDDNPPSLHLTGTECGETAAKCKSKRLVLTHVPPWHEPQGMLAEAVAVYDGPTELAEQGKIYEI
jgi:ribonuclease BN (tRNA processing enzyme)